MKRVYVLELPDGRALTFDSFDAVKARWASDFVNCTDAVIDAYPPEGMAWAMVSYRFDPEVNDWVQSN